MNRIRTRIFSAAVMVLGALGAGTTVASPAQAALPCAGGAYSICFYEHANYEGIQIASPWSNPAIIWQADRQMDNKISSIRTNDNQTWCFYQNRDLTGERYAVYPGWQVGQVPAYINDKISSARRGNC
jgi:hypothetical protein